MTGKTHRAGGVLCALGGFILLDKNGMLLDNVSPALQLTVIYPFALYGSVFSDLDHHWDSSPCKDIVSRGVNGFLHLTTPIRKAKGELKGADKVFGILDARHRSWQTHSDLFTLGILMLGTWLANMSGGASVDAALFMLVTWGMLLGVLSHMLLDMLTPEGIHFLLLRGINAVIKKITNKKKTFLDRFKKISLVPNTSFFRTGSGWEVFVRHCVNFSSFVCLSYIAYDMYFRVYFQ